MSKLTKQEILEETIKFYSENPNLRGVVDGGCAYNGGSGKHCAIGRCLMVKHKKLGINFRGNGQSVHSLIRINNVSSVDEMLSPKYRGHGLTFWENLQKLHDEVSHWDDNGITEKGKVFAEHLRLDIYGNIITEI